MGLAGREGGQPHRAPGPQQSSDMRKVAVEVGRMLVVEAARVHDHVVGLARHMIEQSTLFETDARPPALDADPLGKRDQVDPGHGVPFSGVSDRIDAATGTDVQHARHRVERCDHDGGGPSTGGGMGPPVLARVVGLRPHGGHPLATLVHRPRFSIHVEADRHGHDPHNRMRILDRPVPPL